MYVNVSRSKLLINNRRPPKKKKKAAEPSVRCNHCGGPIRPDGEFFNCLMCSREQSHVCSTCAHVRSNEVSGKQKKSA